ncbi:MAG: 30S ribosomal protein S17 [Planctomycetota bacterium]
MSSEARSEQAAQPGRRRSPRRATQTGVVTSAARQKTIRVTVAYNVRHPKYGKYLRRETTLHAHDEHNECRTGDVVEVMQCRPLSKTKCWRLVRVLKRAPQPAPAAAAAPPEVQP